MSIKNHPLKRQSNSGRLFKKPPGQDSTSSLIRLRIQIDHHRTFQERFGLTLKHCMCRREYRYPTCIKAGEGILIGDAILLPSIVMIGYKF